MSSKQQKYEYFIEEWMRVTGKTDIDMHAVAQLAIDSGFSAPKPMSAVELLAKDLAHAAREKTRVDDSTGRPYRAYHAYRQEQGGHQLTLWVDIDTAPRPKMWKSLQMRRKQMIGDAVAVTDDADHWNRMHPNEEPIQIPLDLTPDVEEDKALDGIEVA
jgi:hypothetical protein